MARSRSLVVCRLALLAALLGIGVSAPAHALFFTIDGNGDGVLQLDGSDDLAITFTGTTSTGTPTGVVNGKIRAVNLNISASDIAFQTGSSGFTGMDVLVFDVILNTGSAIVDQIGAAVATSPTGLDPSGAGYLNAPGETTDPATGAGATTFVSGGGFFPGQYRFNYDNNVLDAGNLQAGEFTRRLFLTWTDTGPTSPLAIGQFATFMISSGTDVDFMVKIVPEPGTLMLVGGGLLVLALRRWRR